VRELEDRRDVEEALRAAALHADAGDTFAQGRALLRAGRGRLLEEAARRCCAKRTRWCIRAAPPRRWHSA
jgi:hypothetical protein